jgi:hypothetical protein
VLGCWEKHSGGGGGVHLSAHDGEAAQNPKKIETETLWLSFGLDAGFKWAWGVLWAHRTLSHDNIMCGELGVSSIWWDGVVLLTLGPTSLPASPSPPHPIPSFALSSYFPSRDP